MTGVISADSLPQYPIAHQQRRDAACVLSCVPCCIELPVSLFTAAELSITRLSLDQIVSVSLRTNYTPSDAVWNSIFRYRCINHTRHLVSEHGRSRPLRSRIKTGQATADVKAFQFRHRSLPYPPAPRHVRSLPFGYEKLSCLAKQWGYQGHWRLRAT
jgi:hypothetical protein